MSRIGKKPVTLPKGVTLELQGRVVAVKGPRGELRRRLHPEMQIALADGVFTVARPSEDKRHKALHGLTRTLVQNMVDGVSKGFSQDTRDPGRRLQGRGQAVRRQPDRRVLAPGQVRGAEGHQDLGREQHDRQDRRRRQGGRRSGRRRAARGASARALQGQGHPLLRESRSAARPARQEPSKHAHYSRTEDPAPSFATAATSGCAGAWQGRRSGRGWWCSARSSTSTPSSSTTISA